MKKFRFSAHVNVTLLSAIIYLLADLSVQATGFLTFGSYIGIKNFLPSTLGLQFGIGGILGSCIGCIATALILKTPINLVLFELVCICVVGGVSWILWHLGSTTHKIHFKRVINIMKYIGILLFTSAICGFSSFLFIDGGDFLTVLSSYTALGFLVGIPVNTILNSTLCVEPILPPMYSVEYALCGNINSDSESIGMFNDRIEELAFEKNIPMKRMFEIQSCIEELAIRIFTNLPDADIKILVDYDDTLSAKFIFAGEKYNPLRISRDEDELDIISLTLVKHRALRAAYKYKNKKNHIHIVL